MRLGQMFRWLPGGSSDNVKQESSPANRTNRDESAIYPVLWEYRNLGQVVQDSEQEAIDNSTLDKLENYYYKEVDDSHIVAFLYERVPKKLEDMHVDYFEERVRSLEGMLEAMNNKLTRKTAANYDKFCVGIQTVGDIKQIVLTQSEQFSVAKAKHQQMKEFWAYKVQRLLSVKRRADKKKAVLIELEFLKDTIGWLVEAYKEGLMIVKDSSEWEIKHPKIRQLFMQVKKFKSEGVRVSEALRGRHASLASLADRATAIAAKGSVSVI